MYYKIESYWFGYSIVNLKTNEVVKSVYCKHILEAWFWLCILTIKKFCVELYEESGL